MSTGDILSSVKSILTKPIEIPGLSSRSKPRRQPTRSQGRASQGRAPLSIEGQIEEGRETGLSIGGTDFKITSDTWILGEVKIGARAKVKLNQRSGSVAIAASIRIL